MCELSVVFCLSIIPHKVFVMGKAPYVYSVWENGAGSIKEIIKVDEVVGLSSVVTFSDYLIKTTECRVCGHWEQLLNSCYVRLKSWGSNYCWEALAIRAWLWCKSLFGSFTVMFTMFAAACVQCVLSIYRAVPSVPAWSVIKLQKSLMDFINVRLYCF